MNNRIYNASNPHQGSYKRVLCVCSAGLLRSPTTAVVLSKAPYNYNTRAAGLEGSFALIKVTRVLLSWADEVVCMNRRQQERLRALLDKVGRPNTPVYSLDIPDSFAYRDPRLVKAIKAAYNKIVWETINDSTTSPTTSR